MPSSTSSSNRSPKLPYRRIWILAIALVVTVVVGAELFWRSQGHRASITDDPTWWAIHRQAASQENAVVIIGASRTQLGFSSREFHQAYPERPLIRLEVAGKGAYEVLQDLAEDDSFKGLVICSVAPSGDVGRGTMPEYLDISRNRVSLDRQLNRTASAWLQDKLVFLSSEVGTLSVIRSVIDTGQLPLPRYIATHFDRSRSANFNLWRGPDSPEIRRQRVVRWAHKWGISDAQKWPERIQQAETLVSHIQRRGGNVVFLAMPVTGPFYSMNERVYPKRKFWDKFATATNGVAVHYLDVPGARDLNCPDSSHLDQRDAPQFTRSVLEVLKRREVL